MCSAEREGERLKLLLKSSLLRPSMNEHVVLLQINTDFYEALANEPNQQFVLSVICGESVKDSTWGAHYTAKAMHFQWRCWEAVSCLRWRRVRGLAALRGNL